VQAVRRVYAVIAEPSSRTVETQSFFMARIPRCLPKLAMIFWITVKKVQLGNKGSGMVRTLLVATVLVAWGNLTLAQDIDNGAAVFKKCAICHKIGPGAINAVGPELNGLDGRPAGSVPEFSY
jgi:mono/diheme cytochrome c family protein